MQNQKLNDREEAVCITALYSFLHHVIFWKKGSKYIPLNEHDILDPGHTKAHLITAIQKMTGQPISHAFQNPSAEQLRARVNKRAQAENEITEFLTAFGCTPQKIESLFFDLYIVE